MNLRKMSLLFAALVVSASASAANITIQSNPTVGTAPGPLTPIRMARIQGIVTKQWNEKQIDGSFKSMEAEVCRISDQIPVFEVEGGSLEYNPTQFIECKTDLKVGPSTIKIFGVIALLNNLDDPFNPGTKASWKGFVSGFIVANDKGDFQKLGSVSVSVVENQTEKSMIQSVFSSELTANNNGDIKLNENISMAVKLVD